MKKRVVIDTNLIFSALFIETSAIREILLDSNVTFYAPNFIIAEIFKHQRKIFKLTKLSEIEFFTYFNRIIENVNFVPLSIISIESREKAYNFCIGLDLKDIPFIALSLELNAPLFTGDNKLKNGLLDKGFDNFYIKT